MPEQPKADVIFELHRELSALRTVSGYDRSWQIWKKGKWRNYKASKFSQARMKCLIEAQGIQQGAFSWDFPDTVKKNLT